MNGPGTKSGLAHCAGDHDRRGGRLRAGGRRYYGPPGVVGRTAAGRRRTASRQRPLSLPAIPIEPPVNGAVADTSLAPVYPSTVQPTPAAPFAAEPPLFAFAQQPVVADWYARFDYFFWNERNGGTQIDSEHGTLYTLGCSQCFGADRFRGEIFTGTMNFSGYDWFGTWFGSFVESHTNYLGVRGEYEWVWDLNLHGCPPATVFAGIGTRFWIRDIKDDWIPGPDSLSVGYQETWWTLYPYLGLEKRWPCNVGEEIYARGRLGCTVFTYEFFGGHGGVPLYPRPDLTGQVEVGFRHDQLFIAAYFEAMTWNESPTVRNAFQPLSQMFTTGLKLGLSF